MAGVIVSYCHASYPFQKCGIIVPEGLWLLSWDFIMAILPLWRSKLWRMGIHIVTMSLSQWFFLPRSVTQPAWTFFCIYTHETQWQWSRCSLYLSVFMRFDLWFIRGDPHFPVCPSSWRLPAQIWLITEFIFQICFFAFISPLPPHFWNEATRGKKWTVKEAQKQRFAEWLQQTQGACRWEWSNWTTKYHMISGHDVTSIHMTLNRTCSSTSLFSTTVLLGPLSVSFSS